MIAKLAGTGRYLPPKLLTNKDLESMVDTSDEWIRQRAGIAQRHIADEHETNVYMATEAAKIALQDAGVDAAQIDLIVVATSTPDTLMPSTASRVQYELGATCGVFDISAACSGYIYMLDIVRQYFEAGRVEHMLIIGSERMSRFMDWSDRSTCVLFGDGAAATVFSASDVEGLINTTIFCDGQHRDLLYVPNAMPQEAFSEEQGDNTLKMTGNAVFRHAVSMMGKVVDQTLEGTGYTQNNIDWLVPHQANERIITATAKKLGLPMDKVVMTLGDQGNTSAATIPLALDIAIRDGRIKRGDLLLLEAFGAGFTWGAALLRY